MVEEVENPRQYSVVRALLENVSGKKIGEDISLCFMPEF